MVKFILLLVLAQAVRALLDWLLIGVLGVRNTIAQPVSLIVMAAAVWLAARPTWQDLGWDLRGTSKGTWWLYGAMAAILAMLLAANLLLDPTLWLQNMYGVILVPIVEESIFRGLGWGRLSKTLPQKGNSLITWVLISILFGLWHLGYADVVLWYADSPVSLAYLPTVMLWKVLVGGFIGGVAGLARWRWEKLPGAVFIHAMFNIFGR
jgi:membrane protease YdiL (CAAX protease family)